MAGLGIGNRDWARRIEERVAKGEKVGRYAIEMAEAVLNRPVLRGGKHARRPDAKDRQAADYHDEERVPI